jgi:hypothetical protein
MAAAAQESYEDFVGQILRPTNLPDLKKPLPPPPFPPRPEFLYALPLPDPAPGPPPPAYTVP